MKKQTIKTPLTKDDLKKELSNYPTKQDLKNELSNYPTKQDLNNELNERFSTFHNALSIEMDYKFKIMREDISRDISKFTNLIFTTFDPLLKELETRRQDREIAAAQMEDTNIRINDHEKRITNLENS